MIRGGQTGADQGGLRAARAAGIPTSGFAPKGWLIESEDGRHNVPAPWLAEYGLVECPEPGYPARTLAYVRCCNGISWFGDWVAPAAWPARSAGRWR